MSNVLKLGPRLTLPVEAATESIALLAKKGAGKSNAAVVLAEEMYAAGIPWVAIDPKGDYYGIRSSKTGKSAGLPVPILGGLHGDIPLEPGSGKLIADLIVSQNLTCVLDVSDFASDAKRAQFLTDLGAHLFRLHGREPQVRHLILEEADDIIPQRVMHDMAKCVGIWTKIVKQGRQRGLGITLVSQRSAVVNKDALTQTEILVALRTTSPQDRAAIKDWVDYHDVSKEVVDSLPTLALGEAWFCSPQWFGGMKRARFRQRMTFDSGATPEMGERRKVATLADIDLGALEAEMKDVIERTQADDPARLRKRITELENKLAQMERQPAGVRIEEKTVEVPVPYVPEEVVELVDSIRDGMVITVESLGGSLSTLEERIRLLKDFAQKTGSVVKMATQVKPSKPAETYTPPAEVVDTILGPVIEATSDQALDRSERKVLVANATHDGVCEQAPAAILGGFKMNSTWRNALSRLRTRGYIVGSKQIALTAEGWEVLGHFEPLPKGEELLEWWCAHHAVGPVAERILRLLYANPETFIDGEGLARILELPYNSTLRNSMSRLRSLGLAQGHGGLQISPNFF